MKTFSKVSKARGSEYGSFRDNANVAQEMKNRSRNPRVSRVRQEALDQILSKISRLACGNPHNLDSWLDIANYATLAYKHTKKGTGL